MAEQAQRVAGVERRERLRHVLLGAWLLLVASAAFYVALRLHEAGHSATRWLPAGLGVMATLIGIAAMLRAASPVLDGCTCGHTRGGHMAVRYAQGRGYKDTLAPVKYDGVCAAAETCRCLAFTAPANGEGI